MKFSIIMQSYLGEYKNAATNRESKLIRAIQSVIDQTFQDWELIVIADGCEQTFDIVSKNFEDYDNIECIHIHKQSMWSGACRNYALSKANGEFCLYLDGDDYYGQNHLQKINDSIGSYDWAYFNDLLKTKDGHLERRAIIQVKGQYGTSNIVHKTSLNARWTSYGYGNDDWGLAEHLKKLSKNYGQIATPEYFVCHVPGKVDL